LFQFEEGKNCTLFTKIVTKLKQKLEYKDQFENEKMTHDIIVTRIIVTSLLCHCHMTQCQRDKFFIFFKN